MNQSNPMLELAIRQSTPSHLLLTVADANPHGRPQNVPCVLVERDVYLKAWENSHWTRSWPAPSLEEGMEPVPRNGYVPIMSEEGKRGYRRETNSKVITFMELGTIPSAPTFTDYLRWLKSVGCSTYWLDDWLTEMYSSNDRRGLQQHDGWPLTEMYSLNDLKGPAVSLELKLQFLVRGFTRWYEFVCSACSRFDISWYPLHGPGHKSN